MEHFLDKRVIAMKYILRIFLDLLHKVQDKVYFKRKSIGQVTLRNISISAHYEVQLNINYEKAGIYKKENWKH